MVFICYTYSNVLEMKSSVQKKENTFISCHLFNPCEISFAFETVQKWRSWYWSILYKTFTVRSLSQLDSMSPETKSNVYCFERTYLYCLLVNLSFCVSKHWKFICKEKRNFKINIPYIHQNFSNRNLAVLLFVIIIILICYVFCLLFSFLSIYLSGEKNIFKNFCCMCHVTDNHINFALQAIFTVLLKHVVI